MALFKTSKEGEVVLKLADIIQNLDEYTDEEIIEVLDEIEPSTEHWFSSEF